jgi:hypothetical protein
MQEYIIDHTNRLNEVLKNFTIFENECLINNIKLYKMSISFQFDLTSGEICKNIINGIDLREDYLIHTVKDNVLYITTNCYYMLYNIFFSCILNNIFLLKTPNRIYELASFNSVRTEVPDA